MSAILFLMLAFSVWAQQFQYRLDGSFQSNAQVGTSPTIVNYSLSWNETANAIQGIYQDNFFTSGRAMAIAGNRSDSGRTFFLTMPAPANNVRTISFTTNESLDVPGSISTSVITRDNNGGLIDNQSTVSQMSIQPAANIAGTGTTDTCVVGFGALTKFCGLYNGTFTEISDSADRCNLVATGTPRLELGADTVLRMYVNYVPGIANPPAHILGSFVPSPTTTALNLSKTDCAIPPATTFERDSCRTMTLTGFFSSSGTGSFSGTYSIIDNETGDACSYNMSLTREVAY